MSNDILSKNGFDALTDHVGHRVQLVGYSRGGQPPYDSLTLECGDCAWVIWDWEPEWKNKGKEKKCQGKKRKG